MLINLENVSLKRNGKTILKEVNWQVKKGEHWSILGLNGSGKTMLLNIINGYLWPSSGKVEVFGKEFGTYPLWELRKSIGWVSSSLQEKLYGNEYIENVVLSGKFASIGLWDDPDQEDIDKALHLIEQFGCSHLINRAYESLSQGEKQRVLIARALMAEPKLLILDEPCTGLDIFAREQLLHFIENLGAKEGAPTFLYVTHHIDEVLPTFEHMFMLKNGEVFAAGKKEELLTSNNLSAFFEHHVAVDEFNNRTYLKIKSL
jgi:iron complex transport system ATP-binding protein